MSIAAGIIGVCVLLVMLALRVPVAIALISVSFGGIGALIGWAPAIGILQNTPYSFAAGWTLSAIPMFLLMGFVAYHGGLTNGLFDAAKILTRRLPGGLAIGSIFACSGFAAVSGSSLACASAMGRIAIPQMISAGYKPSFAGGTIAAGGTIGALIPPSILMIVYGIFAETSITAVFLGGITIGVVTALAYSAVVLITAWLRPDIVPREPIAPEGLDARRAMIAVWPALLLILLVFGGLFAGVFTATEAGAVGAAGALLLTLVTGRMTRKVLADSFTETLVTSASLFIIGIGATMFTRFLGITGLTSQLSNLVSDLGVNYLVLMLAIVAIYLILGMFMEPFGALLVTLPVFLPLVEAQGVSLIWFGVLVVKLLEIGMITPPIGLNVFIIRNVAKDYVRLSEIFRGVLPFFLIDLLIVLGMILIRAV